MCRLYGLRANEQTKVECSLVHSMNSLISQSGKGQAGERHEHGWGVAAYPDGVPSVEKQAWAAYHGEHFRKTAANIYSKLVIAHVRRATVGPPTLENTHPFLHGRWSFAHNGTVPNFDHVRDLMLDSIDPLHRTEIHGSTDSEHIFRYLLSLWEHNPAHSLLETLKTGLTRMIAWSCQINARAPISLNILWSDGEHLVGSRRGRTLWYLERDGIHHCEICGSPHVHHKSKTAYRAVEIASEPLSHERWRQVPNDTVFTVGPDLHLHFEPLETEGIYNAAPQARTGTDH